MIRLLTAEDADAFLVVRRRSLQECPLAFAASVADDRANSPEAVRALLEDPEGSLVLGSFEGGLVGIVGLHRNPSAKRRHRAHLWGTWYEQAFPSATRTRAGDFELLSIDGCQLEIVPADEKVGSGAAGSVVYWRVEDLNEAIHRIEALGARVYRGPRAIDQGLGMGQMRDPWGNCIGLPGPFKP